MAWAPLVAMGGSILYDQLTKKDSMNKVDNYSKGQKGILNQLLQMIDSKGGLGQGNQEAMNLQRQYMDPSSQAVQQFAQPYMNQFNQQTIPGLAERFAGYGGMGGGLSSSGFGQSLSAAGGNLQAQLAALKSGIGQQAAQSIMGQFGQMQGNALNAQPFSYQQQAPSMTGGMMQGWAQGGFAGAGDMGNSLANAYQKYMPIMGNI